MLFGETDGVWFITTYLEKGPLRVPFDKRGKYTIMYVAGVYSGHPSTRLRAACKGGSQP